MALSERACYAESMEELRVACSKCGGGGTVPLPPYLLRLYRLIEENPGLQSSALRVRLPERLAAPAMSMRLSHLLALGLVEYESESHATGGVDRSWRVRRGV